MENNNEKSIQRLIMEISRMYMEKRFGKLKSLGIHPRQMPILAVLWKEDGCSQKELASQLGVKPPTVTVSIQRLEKIGIIVRKQDEKDQRISRIYLTEEGKAIINEGMRMAKEGENDSAYRLRKILRQCQHQSFHRKKCAWDIFAIIKSSTGN